MQQSRKLRQQQLHREILRESIAVLGIYDKFRLLRSTMERETYELTMLMNSLSLSLSPHTSIMGRKAIFQLFTSGSARDRKLNAHLGVAREICRLDLTFSRQHPESDRERWREHKRVVVGPPSPRRGRATEIPETILPTLV